MSCSEKDLISVYLDGEMPEIYREKFEKHLENCTECKKIYDAFKKQHEMLNYQAENMEKSSGNDSYLDESFARLQTRLSYSKVAGKKNIFAFDPSFGVKNSFGKNVLKSVVSASAAAAVFALVFVPVYKITVNKNGNEGNQNFTAIARTELTPVHEQKVLADKNVSNVKIAPVFGSGNEGSMARANETEINEELFDAVNAAQNINKNQKVVNAAMASYGNSLNNMGNIDLFKPGFIEEDVENMARRNPYANHNVSNMNFRPPMDRSIDRRMPPPDGMPPRGARHSRHH